MKNNVLKFGLAALGCMVCSQDNIYAKDFMDYVHPFIEANGGTTVLGYIGDVAEEYIPYSQLVSENNIDFTYGVSAGVRFLDDDYVYRSGIQTFYNRLTSSAALEVYRAYNTLSFDIEATHNLIGGEFDNYIRVMHNEKSETFGSTWDSFVVLGLDAGKIKSEYTVDILGTNFSLNDDGLFYGPKIEYLTENKSGLGFTVGIKYLKANVEAIEYLFMTKLGIRYTF